MQRTYAAALLAVVLAVVLLVVAYWATRPGPQGPGPPGLPGLTPAEAQRLVAATNVGLALLENQKLDAAHQAFQPIAQQLPAEPLGPRNLAVARVLALGIDYEPAPPEAVSQAREAMAAIERLEGKSLAWHWLALRVSLAGGDFAAAEAHLAAIEAATPNDAAAWYTRYRVLKLQDPQEQQAATSAALDKARELDAASAWLLTEWLRSQATRLDRDIASLPPAEAERAAALAALAPKLTALADQLNAARPTAQAFAHVIRAHANVDVLAFLDQAADAARAGNPATAVQRMRVLANVLLPHAAPDQQPLRRHPLEFALDRFSPKFDEQAKVANQANEPPIAVAFAATLAWQLSAELAQDLGTVRDVALADFDLDGRTDLLVLGHDKVVIYGRTTAGQPWSVLATAAAAGARRLLATDLDSDFDETRQAVESQLKPDEKTALSPALRNGCPSADVDLVLYGDAGITLVENRADPSTGQRSLVPVAGDKLPPLATPVQALAVADLEADGDLDLVLATASGLALWSNTGEWTFADVSDRSVLPSPSPATTELLALDWDRDVDIDLLVAADSGGGWLENLRHGQFRWRAFADAQPELNLAQALAAVDANGNAAWDLLAARTNGIAFVADSLAAPAKRVPAVAIDEFVAQRLITWDYDNDSWDDCLALGTASARLFRGRGEGKFEQVPLLDAEPAATAADVGDLDSDGDLDLAIVSQGSLNLRENQGGNANHWIDVALQAQQIKGGQHAPSGRVSPFGIGSLLELKAGSRYQAQVVTRQTTHFGLGRLPAADAIRVSWLNGVPQNIIQPAADLFVCEQQLLNTSCPYLYAWNGERYEFVTDLLWNAPLGLQLAEGQLAPARNWEYLKIPGEALAERDGHYWLQVAAELWEADYFDEMRLIAIDHPADVEIYSNEKVGSAEMAAYKVHTVSHPRLPVAARGQGGRDLLPEISRPDGVYARPFDRKLRQGVVEEHSLELDLPDVPPAAKVTLFLTGWVFPASTSINVALSQGGSLSPPRPPSFEIQDERGQWQPLLPFMGFPGGKTKTIAIELPLDQLRDRGALTRDNQSSDSLRLRITTSMELYWDHIFFTVDETPAKVRTTDLTLVSADLHERGFSRVVPDPANGPEKFLYDDCSPLAKWPPMLGRFTRLGDVKDLLTSSDDRLLVMGAGDETTLRFAVPNEPLPPGWKRDFLLYSVGWDKDANLETILGQTVEPLPFRAMTAYPWPATENSPDSAAYIEYLRKYQTREQTLAYWWWFRSAAGP